MAGRAEKNLARVEWSSGKCMGCGLYPLPDLSSPHPQLESRGWERGSLLA